MSIAVLLLFQQVSIVKYAYRFVPFKEWVILFKEPHTFLPSFLAELKVKMKTDISYDPPKNLVDAAGRSLGSNARVMMDKRILYTTFKTMMSK